MTSIVILFENTYRWSFNGIALLLFLAISLYQYFIKFEPIKRRFKEANKKVWDRYKELGINTDDLSKEIKD